MEPPPSWFVIASAIWGECLNYRGEGSGVGRRREVIFSLPLTDYTPPPLGSLDTLPRSRSLLQTKNTSCRPLFPKCVNMSKCQTFHCHGFRLLARVLEFARLSIHHDTSLRCRGHRKVLRVWDFNLQNPVDFAKKI